MNSVLINRCKQAIKSLQGCKGTSEQELLACFRIALTALEQQHINSQSVPLQLTTTVDGREWKLFCVNFKSDDAVHSAYFYAIDREHASYRLEDLKQTGELQWGNLLSITG